MKNKKVWVSVLAGIMAMLMLLTLIVGLLPVGASAASSSEIKKELDALKKQKAEIQKEINGLKDQLADNMSEMEKIVTEKNIIDQEIGLLNQQILNVNEQIAVYGTLIADKQDELDTAKAHWEALNEKNKERIRAMEEDGNLSYWAVLFKANSFADLLDRLNMIEEIAASDQRRLEEMNAAAKAVAAAQAELETEKAALEETKIELDQMQAELAIKRGEADEILLELIEIGEEYEKLVDEAEADEEALLAEIAKAEQEYNKAKRQEAAAAAAKAAAEAARKAAEAAAKAAEEAAKNNANSNNISSSDAAAAASGIKWLVPCSYRYMSSPYGWRVHPVYGDYRFHSGVDLAAASGTPIYATRSGTVTTATYGSSSGYYVTINHGDGFSSSYLHMTHYIVSVGQKVSAGQVIGYVGSTGTSTGAHLHFSIYYNGATQNPSSYVKFY